MKRLPRIGLVDTSTSNIKSVFYALKEFNCDVVELYQIWPSFGLAGLEDTFFML